MQDESALHSVEIEKVYSGKREVLFEFRAAASDEEVSDLRRALQEKEIDGSLQMADGSVEVAARCEPPTDISVASRVLQLLLESLGSTAANSFHIYFDARPDAEASRERLERVLNDPDASSFRREVATRALEALDEKLEEKRGIGPRIGRGE